MSKSSIVLAVVCIVIACSCSSTSSRARSRWADSGSSPATRLAAAKSLVSTGDTLEQVESVLGPPTVTIREWGVETPSLDEHPDGNTEFCRWRLTYRFPSGGIDVVMRGRGIGSSVEDAAVENIRMAACIVALPGVALKPIGVADHADTVTNPQTDTEQ